MIHDFTFLVKIDGKPETAKLMRVKADGLNIAFDKAIGRYHAQCPNGTSLFDIAATWMRGKD